MFVDHRSLAGIGASDDLVLNILAHEMLHALLGTGHIQHGVPALTGKTILSQVLGAAQRDVIGPVDQTALLARYSDAYPNSLGEWGWAETGLFGVIDDGAVTFGVDARNGRAYPFATVAEPATGDLGGPGRVTWSGRLLGLTPDEEAVAGSMSLTVDLGDSTGDLDFGAMEHWGPSQAPGALGTGSIWGDGDLSYGVVLGGSGFVQDGTGDSGTVTGIFAGQGHSYAAGVLERHDLMAGFGGSR